LQFLEIRWGSERLLEEQALHNNREPEGVVVNQVPEVSTEEITQNLFQNLVGSLNNVVVSFAQPPPAENI
jgi:hypothetical protein